LNKLEREISPFSQSPKNWILSCCKTPRIINYISHCRGIYIYEPIGRGTDEVKRFQLQGFDIDNSTTVNFATLNIFVLTPQCAKCHIFKVTLQPGHQ